MPKNKSQLRRDAVNGGRRWASINDAAAYLGITDRAIRLMIADGRLDAYRGLGSRVLRIDLAEIDEKMASGQKS